MKKSYHAIYITVLLLLCLGFQDKASGLTLLPVDDVKLDGKSATYAWLGGNTGFVADSNYTDGLNDILAGGQFFLITKYAYDTAAGGSEFFDSISGYSFNLWYPEPGDEDRAGTFSLTVTGAPAPASLDFVFLLKAGTGWAFYYFDDFTLSDSPQVANGEYAVTFDSKDGSPKSLSHLTLFARLEPTQPVPEPATLLLFGSGILGLAGIVRRKKR